MQLDFSDEPEEKAGAADGKSKKKKSVGQAHVKITGRKENVEEAKKRILAQIERLVSTGLNLSLRIKLLTDRLTLVCVCRRTRRPRR